MAVDVTPFQYAIQVTIDKKTIDYLLTVDETGHVYEAKPIIFELPDVAQQFILGQTDGMLARKVRAFPNLVRYLLPLVLADQLTTLYAGLQPLAEDIRTRLHKKGIRWLDLHHLIETKSLISKIQYACSTYKQSLQKQDKLWGSVIQIISNMNRGLGRRMSNRKSNTSLISHLSECYPNFANDFLPAIIPFLKIHEQCTAFKSLWRQPSKANQKYLLSELKQPYSQPYANAILIVLHKYDVGDVEAYNTFIQFYDRTHEHTAETLGYLIALLEKHPTSRTQEIGFKTLKLNKGVSAETAARVLLKIGIPPQQIIDVIIPFLKAADPKISKATFAIFKENEALIPFLPDAAEVLDIYIETLSKGWEWSIAKDMNKLAGKIGIYSFSMRICKLVNHKNTNVRTGMLKLITSALQTDNVNTQPFLTQEMYEQYLNIAKDNDTGRAKNCDNHLANAALDLLGNIGIYKKDASYVDILIGIYYQTTSYNIREEVLSVINKMFKLGIPYQPQIEPIFLDVLKNNTSQFTKAKALIGLCYTPDKEMKKTLLKYLVDFQLEKSIQILMFNLHSLENEGKVFLQKMLYAYDDAS